MGLAADGIDLMRPITDAAPCGESLEDTALMSTLDAFQLFGRSMPWDPKSPPPWRDIKQKALDALAKSKDLRALAHLSAATLRVDDLATFVETVGVAASWLQAHWPDVYPKAGGDWITRRNALSDFADNMAVLDGLRRVILVDSRQFGRFSLRDIELASGKLKPKDDDKPANPAEIDAAFGAVRLEELTSLSDGIAGTVEALKSIDGRMRGEHGIEAAPEFDGLLTQLDTIQRELRTRIAARPDGQAAGAVAPGADSASAAAAPAVGRVQSREDAIRALSAVADFFRQTEPSSPIPMLLERASRLVSKDFLAVLSDLTPDAVVQARRAVGLKDE